MYTAAVVLAKFSGPSASTIVASSIIKSDYGPNAGSTHFVAVIPATAAISDNPGHVSRYFLGVIRIHAQVSKQERLPAGFLASPMRLDGHKYCIDLF